MFELKPARIENAEALAAFAVRTFHATFSPYNTPENMASYVGASFNPSRQLEEIGDPRSRVTIAFAGDAIAGYSHLRIGGEPNVRDANAIELVRLYVGHEWHGKGVAAALMQDAVAHAERAGFMTLWLGVWERNERALAFYKKSGFVEIGSHVFELGSDRQNDLILAKGIKA